MRNKKLITLAVGALLLVGATAAASVYLTRENMTSEKEVAATTAPKKSPAAKKDIVWNDNPQPRAPQQQAAARSGCDDGNIAGKVAGGVGGGVLGSMVGKGNGKTVATIGGTLGGAYLGGQTLPLHNVTCP
jgi:uncharacterized protein YcfJ